MELKPCPNIWCECDRVTVWKAKGGKNLRRVRYFVECDNCHQEGPAKRFRWSAIRAWNHPWKGRWIWQKMPCRRVGEGEKE